MTQVSTEAIYISAGALVLSAVIAAIVAIWRTRATLGAEARRLDKQLAHDRALRERQELRGVIDDAIRTVQNGIYRAIELRDAITAGRQARGSGSKAAAVDREYERARVDLGKLIRRLNGFQSRLAVRLGTEGGLAEGIKDCRVQLGVVRMLAPGVHGSDQRDVEELSAVIEKASDASEAFEAAALQFVRSRLRDR